MKALGMVLVVVGLAALVYGGISWTRKDTIVDAGPLEITRDKTEGIALPPVAGALLLVAGIALLVTRGRA
ncbi:MAG: DUF3185 domain-containing protein [Vicinamibacterales bacterium]